MQLPLFEIGASRNAKRSEKREGKIIPFSSARNHWQTPQTIIEHAVAALGRIDLDPCSTSKNDPHVPAAQHLVPEDNSLEQPWQGRVWLNPPFGRAITPWIEKVCVEYEHGGVTAAIVLVPARTDTNWWQYLTAYPYCAIRGRVQFIREDDSHKTQPTFPSAAVYLGPQLDRFAGAFADIGTIYIPYNS